MKNKLAKIALNRGAEVEITLNSGIKIVGKILVRNDFQKMYSNTKTLFILFDKQMVHVLVNTPYKKKMYTSKNADTYDIRSGRSDKSPFKDVTVASIYPATIKSIKQQEG